MSGTSPRLGRSNQFAFEERRRSQRVVIRIPVVLRYHFDDHEITFEASTVSVNDHGAMLLSSRNLNVETVFEMENGRTHEKLSCRVTRAPIVCPEGYLIPVEFLAPAADFWRISFPPTNWKPGEE